MKKAHFTHSEKYISKVIEIESLVSIFEANYDGAYYFPGEFHPFWELVYVMKGEVCVSGDEKVYTLRAGEMIFHKPMEFHRLWSANGKEFHVFITAFRAGGPLTGAFENLALSLSKWQKSEIERLRSFVRRHFPNKNGNYHTAIFREWNERRSEVQLVFNMLERFLLSVSGGSEIEVKSTDSSGVSELYRQIISKLNENVYGQITLRELAEQCNFSTAQLKRAFSVYSDIGIHKYFLKLKIAMSIRLLGKGMPISEISRTLSFSNQNYFSAVFRRETGLPPTEYKRTVLGIK